jgi:hypothetical protein
MAKHRTKPPPLTRREVVFARLWVENDGSHSLASLFLKAGFKPRETPNATETAAWRLVRKREIRAFIRELQSAFADESRASVEKIAQGVYRAAFADRRQLYDERGRLKLPKDWPDELEAAVEAVESDEIFEWVKNEDGSLVTPRRKELVGYVRKVRTAKRAENLKILAQYRKMLTDNDALTTMAKEIAALRAQIGKQNEAGGSGQGSEGSANGSAGGTATEQPAPAQPSPESVE